jgi:MraZ protein
LITISGQGRGCPDSFNYELGIASAIPGGTAFTPLQVGTGVNERELFIGYSLQAIDAKGRVAIPADLRVPMEANSGGRSCYIDLNEAAGCLILFDKGWARQQLGRIDRAEEAATSNGRMFDLERAQRDPVITAEPAKFDESGRFGLSPFLAHEGGLSDLAFFSGAMTHIEIWSPERLRASPHVPDRARRALDWELKKRGLA